MKIFISSLITGMEPFRQAAREAVEQLGHTPVMAEDFGAMPMSPQVACLDGLRQSALTILLIGEHYGSKQASGISATHEEFREARDRRPILAFVQTGVTRDAEQNAFVTEAGSWENGLFRETFTTPEELKSRITKRVHQWEVASAAAPVNEQGMLKTAFSLLPSEDGQRNRYENAVVISVAAGPKQALLRPSQLEDIAFKRDIQKAAMFGSSQIFDPQKQTKVDVRGNALSLKQGNDREKGASITIDGEGNLLFQLPINNRDQAFGNMIVVEEDVTDAVTKALSFATELWEMIDPTQRVSHAAIACCLLTSSYGGEWRTRSEQAARSDSSYTVNMRNGEQKPISLTPAARARSALSYQRDEMVADIVTLLRRQYRER